MKILIANRGEIAVRIMRSCKELGMKSVAVFSDADDNALHVRYADEAIRIGAAPASDSYLNGKAILAAARETGANGIHPGYGFLSENAWFAREVEEAGIRFVGPTPEVLALTGDKLAARKAAREAGLPVLAGSEEPVGETLSPEMAEYIRFPILIKAIAGGGGRGIRLARNEHDFEVMLASARKEALAAFGNDTVYLEQLVHSARHIEVQILGDGKGKYLCFGERECSIQRRHQKLIEESPAPGLSELQRQQIYDYSLRLARHLKYRSLGTVEFLMDKHGDFYFIEVNPRIQVEHPVTEMVTRTDLVGAQLQLALEGGFHYQQNELAIQGWAIEARILAEDPDQQFMPATGTINYLKEPGGPGIRVDSALFSGMQVGADYDSLLAKVIAWGNDRPHAIRRMERALGEFVLAGIRTDIDLIQQIIASEGFVGGKTDTTYLENFKLVPLRLENPNEEEVALAAALITHSSRKNHHRPEKTSMWRYAAWHEQMRGRG